MATTDSIKSFSNKAFDTTDSKLSSVFTNKFLKNVVIVLLILYAPLAAPEASNALKSLFKNYAAKLLYIFLLAYLLSNSVRVSVVTSVTIVLGIYLIKQFKMNENFTQKINSIKNKLAVEPSSKCSIPSNVEPYSLDNTNIAEYNAKADHEDALHPQKPVFEKIDMDMNIDGYDDSDTLAQL